MHLGPGLADMAGVVDMPSTGDPMSAGPKYDYQGEPMLGSGGVLKEFPAVTQAIAEQFGGKTPTILDSIKVKCPGAQVIYAEGCEVAGCDRGKFAEAVAAAKQADVVILTLGGKYGWGSSCTVGEGIDCDDIGLGGIQETFAQEITALGKPTVLVHMDARPLSSPWAQEHVNAILEYWYPGITGGEALADVLFGDYNPAGRMPITAPRNAGQIPVYTGQKIGNSYYGKYAGFVLSKYSESVPEPLYYFGEGKSYTQFEYSDLKVDPQVNINGKIAVTLTVKNSGTRDGDEVVQLYVTDEQSSMLRPYQEFAGAKRLFIKSGESKQIQFTLRPSQFAFLDQDMRWILEAGDMTVKVGTSSHDIRLTGSFRIDNSMEVDAPKRGFYALAEAL
jgi:beta-glucosidase